MYIHIWEIFVNGQKSNFATKTHDMVEAMQLFRDKFNKENPNKTFNAFKIEWVDSVKFVEDFKKKGW